MRSLSFVLPAFDEAHNIGAAIRGCVAVGERLGAAFEVIVVDDGSRDSTRFIADRIAESDARVRTVHHPSNRGYGAALRSEILRLHPALGARLMFITGDTLSPGAREFLDATACPRLEKPFGKTDLLAAVAALLA